MKSLEELRKIRDEVRQSLDLRAGEHRAKIVVCMGTCGIAAGARDTMKAFMDALGEANVNDVAVTAAGCAGFCEQEPLVEVEIEGQDSVRYGHVDADAAKTIVTEHVVGGNKVEQLVF
ncbi:MAG: (2Fe-2S) ferredoxin domain-containing protein [Lentisphaerae bacterium]|jgi:NADP-reducing hydrogenase subunit HndB|nr:(2Fe-2S) ferredoxin domain-containing protein [Lentisphaerota bacterium]MBT5612243.1 (2Fe-2S) ferredoxin domain-containing protein [Lentisphaerota bacterium]MBT7060779.1 (2Fe-2S) ferredoxin domain-containing protein [Lentisphaerota bacterium]MBT7845222.1 (2Fe-2S) ferredoxin domain-containing protein [Lentisphaerota bacterium]